MSGGVFYANRARRFFCILRFGCELLSLWCNKKTKTMITVTQSIPATCFSANIPDVEFSIGGYRAAVVMTVDGEEIYNERLYPVGGKIQLCELDCLLGPYARQSLKIALGIKIVEQTDSSDAADTKTISADIIYSAADIGMGAADFMAKRFLTLLEGEKVTALNRLEYLHFIGTEAAKVTAEYDDGSTKAFDAVVVAGNDKYTTIDVSADKFVAEGKVLVCYDVQAGARSFRFTIDFDEPDCAPILVFVNSFGVEELLYCTGTHSVAPTYKRDSGYIGRYNRNYNIVETRAFKADTGIMTFAMANWADELLRSQEVHVVNFKDGHANVGKEVTITDSKSEYSNDDDELPRFTFTYQYAQRNHNVVDVLRSGRIFDNTFDNTFE